MKKILIALIGVCVLCACNNQPAGEEKTNDHEQAEAHEQESGTAALTLNNGKKWKSDSATNVNVKNIQSIVGSFNAGSDFSLAAYQNVAIALQQGLDKMISECKMKGPEHNALHQWLEPVIEKTAQLKKSTSVQQAATVMSGLKEQVALYPQYFE